MLLEPYVVEERTAGGLLLPPSVRTKDQIAEQKAVVMAVGNGPWDDRDPPRAKVGDKILFAKWAGYAAVGPADGKDYRVVNNTDIFMRITKEKE